MQIHTPTSVFISYINQNHKYFNINLKSINSRHTLTVYIWRYSQLLFSSFNYSAKFYQQQHLLCENYAIEACKIKQGFRILWPCLKIIEMRIRIEICLLLNRKFWFSFFVLQKEVIQYLLIFYIISYITGQRMHTWSII